MQLKDELLRDFFTGNKDVALTIVDLEEQIEKLERNLSNFKVAEDYRDVQKEADRIENELFALNNKIILIQNNIESVNKSLNMETKTNQDDIAKVYEEANVHFTENLKKTLNDLERFYEKLVTNRKKRLLEQKNKFESEIAAKSEVANRLKSELDRLMKYLGDHQAIDVFLSLSDKSAHLKTKLESLKKYQSLQSEYKEKLRDAEKIQLEQSETAENFLAEIEAEIREKAYAEEKGMPVLTQEEYPLKKKSIVICLMGYQASGKDTLAKLCERFLGAHRCISDTTRPPRKGEDQNDYSFLDEMDFDYFMRHGHYLETSQTGKYWYGLHEDQIEEGINIFVCDTKGYESLKENYNGIVKSVFVGADKFDRMMRRVAREPGITDTEFEARELEDYKRFAEMLPDYSIRNDNLKSAYFQLRDYIKEANNG
jgi:guanylate kinase